ncbi:MAG: Transcriptional regulator, IclR family [uncultured Paraburkholderia sp.]|nr:MAG: Transcriptional regulator, IclR family [uncultured Paraburkholderia sp.]
MHGNARRTYTQAPATENSSQNPLTMDAEDKDDADRYRGPALDKGLDILELLAEQK